MYSTDHVSRSVTWSRRVHRMSFLVSGNHLLSGNLAKGKACLLDWLSCILVDWRAVYSTVTMSLFRSERELLCMQFKIHYSLFLQWRVATERSISSSGSLLDWRWRARNPFSLEIWVKHAQCKSVQGYDWRYLLPNCWLKSRSPQPFVLAHVRSRDVRQKHCRLEDVKMCVHDPLALLQNEALLQPRLKDAGLRFSSASFHRSKVDNSLLKSCGTLPIHAENFVIRTERKLRRM